MSALRTSPFSSFQVKYKHNSDDDHVTAFALQTIGSSHKGYSQHSGRIMEEINKYPVGIFIKRVVSLTFLFSCGSTVGPSFQNLEQSECDSPAQREPTSIIFVFIL